MGLNKKFITQELIKNTESNNIEKLFNFDAVVFDNWSYKFYQLYSSGLSKDAVMKLMSQSENKI